MLTSAGWCRPDLYVDGMSLFFHGVSALHLPICLITPKTFSLHPARPEDAPGYTFQPLPGAELSLEQTPVPQPTMSPSEFIAHYRYVVVAETEGGSC